MTETERINRLHTLAGYLLSKYSLSNKSTVSHKCFNIKPCDVVYIVNTYKDVLLDSRVFISPTTHAHHGYSFDKIEVYAENSFFSISKTWDSRNHFESNFRLDETSEIKIDISCETILSFHFCYPNISRYDQVSFRND